MSAFPFVSVIMPVFSEERFIERSLGTVLAQDYPADRFEVIVADGMSTDRTREIIRAMQAKHPNLRLVDNPDRIVSPGLNRAIESARGEIIARMDGHNEFATDYLRRVVTLLLETGAGNAGGVLVPTGRNGYVSSAVAAAYHSPLGIGGAQRGHADGNAVCEVDTVHGGCWRRDTLIDVGKFDERMVRNQDDELSFRLRKSGARIVQSTAIRMTYAVRDSFKKLFLQFAQYGYWKVQVIRRHPRQASLRHLIPALFVFTVIGLTLLLPFLSGVARDEEAIIGLYLLVIGLESLRHAIRTRLALWPGIAWALINMQIGYGLGFLAGLARCLFGRLPMDRLFERVTR